MWVRMPQGFWESLFRWIVGWGTAGCQSAAEAERDGRNSGKVEEQRPGSGGSDEESSGAKTTTVLIMVAPPKDLQQVLQPPLDQSPHYVYIQYAYTYMYIQYLCIMCVCSYIQTDTHINLIYTQIHTGCRNA